MPYLHRVVLGLIALGLGFAPLSTANPNDYPEFAQQKVDETLAIHFIASDEVKQRLESGAPQMLVDVRNAASYAKAHLPGAVSIPLQTLAQRAGEISRDIPVVLY